MKPGWSSGGWASAPTPETSPMGTVSEGWGAVPHPGEAVAFAPPPSALQSQASL